MMTSATVDTFETAILWSPTGSRWICEPPVIDTDEDFFVLVTNLGDFDDEAVRAGWTTSASEDYSDGFVSYRKGTVNLIVMEDGELYRRSCMATGLAKRFNLLNKQDRVDLFDAIQYGQLRSQEIPHEEVALY